MCKNHGWCIISYGYLMCVRPAREEKMDRSVLFCRQYCTWVFYESFTWIRTWSKHRMGGEDSSCYVTWGVHVEFMGNYDCVIGRE